MKKYVRIFFVILLIYCVYEAVKELAKKNFAEKKTVVSTSAVIKGK